MDRREQSISEGSTKGTGTAIALLAVEEHDRVMNNQLIDVKPASSRGIPGVTLPESTGMISVSYPNCDVALPGLGSGRCVSVANEVWTFSHSK